MTVNSAKVSIIIPIYNTAQYLNQCIQSVVGQTWHNLDIILLDDGSVDDSVEICKKWEATDDRIRVFCNEHLGQGEERNIGIKASAGDYIMFLDSDDYMYENAVETAVKNISQNNADILFFNSMAIRDDGFLFSRRTVNDLVFEGCNNIETMPELLGYYTFLVWEKCYRGDFLRNCSISMENHMCEDILYLAQIISLADKICVIPDELCAHRDDRRGNFSKSYHRFHEVLQIIDMLNKYFMKNGNWNIVRNMLLRVSMEIYKDLVFRIRNNVIGIKKWEQNEFIESLRDSLLSWYGNFSDINWFQNRVLVVGGNNLNKSLDKAWLERPIHLESFFSKRLDQNKDEIEEAIGRNDFLVMDLIGEVESAKDYQIDKDDLLSLIEDIFAKAKQNKVKIFFIKQFLAETYGESKDLQKEFIDIESIRQCNSSLEELYLMIEKKHNNVLFIDMSDYNGWRYSTSGQITWYSPFDYNRIYYGELALRIMRGLHDYYGNTYPVRIDTRIEEPPVSSERFIKWYPILEHEYLKVSNNRMSYKYFADNNVNSIAIYGMGLLGKMLLKEAEASGVRVSYIIDRVKKEKTDSGIEVISADSDTYPQTDLIVVTPVQDYWHIVNKVKSKTDIAIVSLEDIVLYDKT